MQIFGHLQSFQHLKRSHVAVGCGDVFGHQADLSFSYSVHGQLQKINTLKKREENLQKAEVFWG
jgi:hypothetical protein